MSFTGLVPPWRAVHAMQETSLPDAASSNHLDGPFYQASSTASVAYSSDCALAPREVGLMRKFAIQAIGKLRPVLLATLFAVGSSVAPSAPAVAVELVDPHAVLDQTRRDLIEFDKRMQRYKAEQRKEEARQQREATERERAEKAQHSARRKREIAEQQTRAREEREREAQRRLQEEAERERAEKALQETQRQRDASEEQMRAREVEQREARHKEEEAEREKAKIALEEAHRKREATEREHRAREEKEREVRPKQRYSLHGELSNRVSRRSACQQQAEARGLSGRMARRYTRLCFSGLPIPSSLGK